MKSRAEALSFFLLCASAPLRETSTTWSDQNLLETWGAGRLQNEATVLMNIKHLATLKKCPGMIDDGIAAIKKTNPLPGSAPVNIVLFGGSAGGSLAIEAAAQVAVTAIVVAEPSSWRWMSVGYSPNYQLYDNFSQLYTSDVSARVRSILTKIDCPILLLDSDPSGFVNADYGFVMHELTDLGKRAKKIGYSGYEHMFYWGGGKRQMSSQELDEVIEDVHNFVLPHLRTKPRPT